MFPQRPRRLSLVVGVRHEGVAGSVLPFHKEVMTLAVLPSHEIPTTTLDVNGRRLDLKAERLLVVRGDAGVQGGAHGPALPGRKPPPDRDDQTPCFTVPAMAVEELLSVVGLPARQGLLSALDRPNRPQGPT